MKCINKLIVLSFLIFGMGFCLTGCQELGITGLFGGSANIVTDYETEHYNKNMYMDQLFAQDLCVTDEDVSIPGFSGDTSLQAAGLFDLNDGTVDYAYDIHKQIYPASTTKILTALVALNHCSVDEMVTVSANAAAASFPIDAQVCGLQEGDRLSMEALLYGLLLHSGNDNATAIAEYVGGTEEGFADMMNTQARELMAVHTNFITPNGLHDEEHYTTAYDLYLIFNECIKNDTFMSIIRSSSYTADITDAGGKMRQLTWEPTSFYARGEAALPTGAEVIGGKTGYTGEAGNCLILLDEDSSGSPYISIVMGAESKPLLYEDMTKIIDQIPNS